MTQCIGVKANGQLCQRIATGGSDYCPAHDPARAEARHRSASKAARSKKPIREVGDLKVEVHKLIQQVRDKEVDRGDAAICGQLFNVLLRAVELQRRLRETEDLERRLVKLEEQWERQRRGWR